MIDLYTAATSNARRAAIALSECDLPHRPHKLDFAAGDTQKPAFLKINPAGMVPVIVDPDGPGGKPITLAQSSAIVLYCAEKSGRLIPKAPEKRAEVMQWFMQAITDVAPTSSMYHYTTLAPDKSEANIRHFEQRFLKTVGVVDAHLKHREFLAGDFSIADVALYPVITMRKAIIDAAPGLDGVKAWTQRVAARPAVARAIAANG
ncbi:MAG: glutathione S-transferase family protein [Gammaproteobacteria bacterium]|nr:glutathione S-transferase family protein [Gammaproteobacteria bacterium]